MTGGPARVALFGCHQAGEGSPRPALARVPTKHVHAPWEMTRAHQDAAGCRIGRDYPAPIVEHAAARARAIAAYRARLDGERTER